MEDRDDQTRRIATARLAVIGNPVQRSRSPHIYSLLAESCGLQICSYEKISSSPERLGETIRQFLRSGGLGFNVTSPFKRQILPWCKYLTTPSLLTGGVNTARLHPTGQLLGTNTDGAGLLDDLRRLDLLPRGARVLLVGAGSTSRSAVCSLLMGRELELTITNRTAARAEDLARSLRHLGDLRITPPEKLGSSYDLILNATSASAEEDIPVLPPRTIGRRTRCYDVCYPEPGRSTTPFADWCYHHGAADCFSGIGMLVAQARRSFQFWHGILPPITDKVRTILEEAVLTRSDRSANSQRHLSSPEIYLRRANPDTPGFPN